LAICDFRHHQRPKAILNGRDRLTLGPVKGGAIKLTSRRGRRHLQSARRQDRSAHASGNQPYWPNRGQRLAGVSVMMTMPAIIADELGKHLADDFRRLFGSSHQDEAERLDGIARVALECLGKSDALYHNVEHTFLVTWVGRDIIRGRTLTERIEPEDYSHLIVACLLHDIGYVRGILRGDREDEFVSDLDGSTVRLERGASDAALASYHVNRSKIFIMERLSSGASTHVGTYCQKSVPCGQADNLRALVDGISRHFD